MFKKLILPFFILMSSCLHADIISISEIDEIRTHITQQDTLVLFDIDDTLITNSISLGSPPWRSWVKSKLSKYNTEFALYDALTLYIAKNSSYQAVESSTALLVSDLQQNGITAFAFTARGRTQWYTTDIEGIDQFSHYQLSNVAIDFRQTAIPVELQQLEPTYFYDGIIFAQHIQKGDLLKHLFRDLNYRPSLIIFIDDKLDQVQSVEAAVKESGIPFKGFWYRRAELNGANFDPRVANVQLESLLFNKQILSDESALKIIENMPQTNPVDYFHTFFNRFDISELTPTSPLVDVLN